ncbi:MAG: FadR/GntR family transcriptional regulator [Pontibacterium sp.]
MSDNQPLKRQIIKRLKHDIIFGQIMPGEKIPSQRVLASTFDVSRSTVREACTQLEEEGLIKTRPGAASVCCNLLESHFQLSLEGVGDNFEFQRQVMEARASLEGEAAFYAAHRATDEELAALDKEYQKMQGRSEDTTLAKAKADLTFHMKIAESSHNLLIISFSQIFYSRYFNAIYGVLSRTLKKFGRYPDGIRAQHSQIHKALMSRDAEATRKAARDHILYTIRTLEKTE